MQSIFNIISILLLFTFHTKIFANRVTKAHVDTPESALSWLNKYGYNPCSNSTVQCSIDFTSLIKEYQKLFRLKVTGKLDPSTKNHMNKPRCGNQDKPNGELNAPAALSQFKWKRSSLKYSIRGYPTQLSQSVTRSIIREAFQAWTNHIPLEIEEVCSGCSADFTLDFASGTHRDDYPFDGVGGTLAHAFFPEDGRVHFDKDESWTERFDDDKTNLLLVAVHEIGHALGLDHTYNEQSIMYPSYQPMSKSRILPQADRDSIQRIYGKKQSGGYITIYTIPSTTTTKTTTTTTTTRRSTFSTRYSSLKPTQESHPRCRLFLDAAFKHPDGTLHTFVEEIVRRYLPEERQWEKSSFSYREPYPSLPSTLGAAVYNPDSGQAVFFSNRYIYVYNIDSSYQAKIQYNTPLPKRLRNPIYGAIYYKNEIYVITSNTIALFQLRPVRISNERLLSTEFPGFSGVVKTAFSYGHLHHFFTADDHVYVWNELTQSWSVAGQPMQTSWFACSNRLGSLTEKRPTIKPPQRPTPSRHHHHPN